MYDWIILLGQNTEHQKSKLFMIWQENIYKHTGIKEAVKFNIKIKLEKTNFR